MKKHSVLFLLLALSSRLSAQLAPGTIAPDFTAQDISGQTWHLYELLERGKIVVLEVSTTWCQPCWAYHNSHAMQDFYEAHGPEGDSTVQVFFIEGDPQTGPECLSGPSNCDFFTPGNWMNGTTYPYFDNAAIADSLQVSYYPTFFIICPNKKIYQVGQLDAEELWEKSSACPVASGTNNAGIFDYDAGTDLREVCDTLFIEPSFSITNLGSEPLTAATVTLHWDNNLEQTKQWSGNLSVYEEAILEFDSLPLAGAGTLKTTISSINNGVGDDDFSNNVHNEFFAMAEQFTTAQIILKIKTDDYGAETYWEIRNEQDSVLYRGGNLNVGPDGGGMFTGLPGGPGAYGNNALINKTLVLPGNDCYSILFVDAYGDGMCCDYGNGYYRLYNSNNPVVPILTGGEFEAKERRGFGVTSTLATGEAVAAAETIHLLLAPNPVADVLNVQFTLSEPTDVSAAVVNALGQSIYTYPFQQLASGEYLWPLSVNDWDCGVYFIHFREGPRTLTQRFFVTAH